MLRNLKTALSLSFLLLLLLLVTGTAEAAINHTVQSGETVFLIAGHYGTTSAAITGANNLSSPDWIYPGQVLVIPDDGQHRYMVVQGDTVFLIARRFGITDVSLSQANNLSSPDWIYPGQVLLIPGRASGDAPSRGGRVSDADLDLLARLVRAEAGGELYQGQVAVAATVLNRVRDARYPGTIGGVIYQVAGGYYQYCPVQNGTINLPAGEPAYQAARDAVNGWDPSFGATGFYNPAKTTNQWVRSQPVTTVIGNHVFFR